MSDGLYIMQMCGSGLPGKCWLGHPAAHAHSIHTRASCAVKEGCLYDVERTFRPPDRILPGTSASMGGHAIDHCHDATTSRTAHGECLKVGCSLAKREASNDGAKHDSEDNTAIVVAVLPDQLGAVPEGYTIPAR
jgi:hypothetical protein